MKIKIDIISGFLGAGKTTLIKKLLEEKPADEKIVIIENEFGQVGIDGAILSKGDFQVREITSGCICCTLVGEFEKALEEIITKIKPGRIIIEPTGIGKLSDVVKACGAEKLKDILELNMLITVVDVMKYQLYTINFSEFFRNQIENAKTIILSRTQKADRKKVQDVVIALRKLNAAANIITTPWGSLSAERIKAVAEKDVSISLEHQLGITGNVVDGKHIHKHPDDCKCGCGHTHSHNYHADKVFDVWSTETPRAYDEAELKEMLDKLGDKALFGMVLRGKGIFQLNSGKWIQFDYVPGETIIKETDADYSGRLCFIGTGLKKDELGKLFSIG